MPALAYSVSLKSIEAIFGARGFTPGALFSSGEQGAWYDPSDLSTMFQDAAGTTPVTAVEQPVGLLLDKSKGLVTSGTPIDGNLNTATWTKGTGWTAPTARSLVCDGSQGAATDCSATYVKSSAEIVRWTFTVSAISGALIVYPSGGVPLFITTTGTKTVCSDTASNFNIFKMNGAGQTCTITNISIVSIPGYHASQYTTTSRPVLSARVNQYTYSEQFNNAAWSKSRATVSADAVASPTGSTTADKINPNGNVNNTTDALQNITVISGISYTNTIYMKDAGTGWGALFNEGSTTAIAYFNLTAGTLGTVSGTATGKSASITSVGNGWYRCTLTSNASASGSRPYGFAVAEADGDIIFASGTSNGIYVWGADFRAADQFVLMPSYQSIITGTTNDYDTTGFPYYLRFDGTDDSLATGTINPGSVDKAQVFAGVRKLSDAAIGVIAEFSADVSTNNGTFRALAPNAGGTPGYQWLSRGSTLSIAEKSTGYAAPVTNIYAGIGDISGDVSSLRLNGAQVDANVSDQGSGNYGSYPLYVGSRAGSSFRFSGHLYGLIARFSATNLSDATIASTETWVNGKTGAY